MEISNPGEVGTSQNDRNAQAHINQAFLDCMSTSVGEGNASFGRQAADQTAQASSPLFMGPYLPSSGLGIGSPTGPPPGAALELQTDAYIVRSDADEQQEFDLFSNSKFPQCNAAVVASELQIGLNDATGGSAQAGPASVKVIQVAAPER